MRYELERLDAGEQIPASDAASAVVRLHVLKDGEKDGDELLLVVPYGKIIEEKTEGKAIVAGVMKMWLNEFLDDKIDEMQEGGEE